MATIKLNEAQVFEQLKGMGYVIELVSGKWFLNGKEYKLYGLGGLCYILCSIMPSYFGSETNSNRFIKWFINNRNNENGIWPELPILTQAKEKMEMGYVPSKLVYPLNEKELKIIHYLLTGDPNGNSYAVFFHGIGGSGKSTICNLIASIFGEQDVSLCGFTQLGEKFARETLAGKRLWYDPDISANWTESATNTLKKVITNDKDQFEQKGKNPYTAQYRCKALFCCNVAPKFDVSDSGLLRRIIYYSKNKKIDNPDGSLANKRYTQNELIDIVIAALNTDISHFYQDFEKETKEIIMSTNNVAKYGICDNYDTYKVQCSAAGVYPYAQEKWEKLRELFREWISTLEIQKPQSTCGAYGF